MNPTIKVCFPPDEDIGRIPYVPPTDQEIGKTVQISKKTKQSGVGFPRAKTLFYAVLAGVGLVIALMWLNHLAHP